MEFHINVHNPNTKKKKGKKAEPKWKNDSIFKTKKIRKVKRSKKKLYQKRRKSLTY